MALATWAHASKQGRPCNADTALIRALVDLQCYCMRGTAMRDPEFLNDSLFLLLTVEAVTKGPYTGCSP